jgi:hypothetical protein
MLPGALRSDLPPVNTEAVMIESKHNGKFVAIFEKLWRQEDRPDPQKSRLSLGICYPSCSCMNLLRDSSEARELAKD